ncbi:PilZ domain-containing protein [Sneathiella chinensis]|uniref:PilZ domain-containing protein n=1 Tax=Sneathiella chinensis TaxID=349750 RepID=A0ABQ5U387_9PROT|nr:PilZ domain-containing protein [Sneathiella chinensis]GLQ05703.1 hypothetical protein GCM10007924_09240 [Sneathiella chinensis]
MSRFFTVGKYRAHSRKDQRFQIPRLSLVLDTHRFETYDWSLGGFRIDDFPGRPPVGDTVTISELSYSPDAKVAVNCKATVTRIVLGKNQVAFAFNKMDEAAFKFLENASMHRLALLAGHDSD